MKKIIMSLGFALMMSFAMTSCQEQTTGEKMEESMEEAGDDMEDGLEEAGENIEEGAEEVEDEIDDATN